MFKVTLIKLRIVFPGCSRGDDSAESGGGGAGSSPRSEEGGVPLGVRGHASSASVKSESPASPLPHGLHTPAHQVCSILLLAKIFASIYLQLVLLTKFIQSLIF